MGVLADEISEAPFICIYVYTSFSFRVSKLKLEYIDQLYFSILTATPT
jgi:hypothetical protein